jgi:hypothetical protein
MFVHLVINVLTHSPYSNYNATTIIFFVLIHSCVVINPMSWLTTPSNRATQLQLFNILLVTESLSLVGNSALLIDDAYHARIRSPSAWLRESSNY